MNYRTESILVVPLSRALGGTSSRARADHALDGGRVVPSSPSTSPSCEPRAAAAVAIRNARLEDLSLKDALTDVYNRRYFMIRLEEEFKGPTRFRRSPLSLSCSTSTTSKRSTTASATGRVRGAPPARRVLLRHSRSFSVVTRYGGDEFAIVLVNTQGRRPDVRPADRSVVAEYEFRHGIVTVSLGAASLPEDGACGDDLVVAADKALYDAKRLDGIESRRSERVMADLTRLLDELLDIGIALTSERISGAPRAHPLTGRRVTRSEAGRCSARRRPLASRSSRTTSSRRGWQARDGTTAAGRADAARRAEPGRHVAQTGSSST